MTAITERRHQRYALARHALATVVILVLAVSCSVTVDIPNSTESATETAAPAALQPAANDAAVAEAEPRPDSMNEFEVSLDWPESVREFVEFVQTTRGEEFRIIADVRFVDPVELQNEFQGHALTFEDLPVESQEIVVRLDDMYRALGLSNEDFDILGADRKVSGDIAAFYDWEVGEIVFPAPNGQPAADIALVDRPVLVHELGHALQIHSRLAWANELDDQALSLALLEGEAEWLFDTYLWSLSPQDWQAWNDALPEWELSGQPEILETEFAVPYVLGSRFFHARFAQDGLAGIDAAFDGTGRVTAQMLVDPWRFTGRVVRQENFRYYGPDLPEGAQAVDLAYDFQMSAVNWHQVLGATLDGADALVAARGINSFTLPSGWIDADDQLCFSIYINASIGEEAIVERAFATWADAPDVDRWFEQLDRGYEVGGCDPGAGNVPLPLATPGEVLGELATILDAEVWAVESGLSPAAGFCLGWDFLAAIDIESELNLYEWLAAADTNTNSTDSPICDP